MPAPLGHPKWGGRKKGASNKVTTSAKEAIELAFQGLGGVKALTTWAKKNPNEFYTRVWPRILPLQLSGDTENPLIASSPKECSDSNLKWLQDTLAEIRAKERQQQDGSFSVVTRIAGNA